MNVLLLASHAVAEYDDVRMFHDLGYEVFAPGGYENPAQSGEGIRPALPQVPYHENLAAACRTQRERYGDPGPYIDWAKARLHPEVIEWADVIIVHHFLDRWIPEQWRAIRGKRVIWRTCGQSNPDLERLMTRYVDDGLEVVRYSPAEERYFGNHGAFAGQTALIRFGKYPDDYGPWTGDGFDYVSGDLIGTTRGAAPRALVGNITQHMAQRGDACGYTFWRTATAGLPAAPAGPGSEALPGGIGELSYEAMLGYLRSLRAYLYTGTTPASYTLGLIEAMLSGVPVVSISKRAWGGDWGGTELFEADEIVGTFGDVDDGAIRTPEEVAENTRDLLQSVLTNDTMASYLSTTQRKRAIDLFGIETVGAQWKALLA